MSEIEIEREDDGSIEVEIEIESGSDPRRDGAVAIDRYENGGELTVRFNGDPDVEMDTSPEGADPTGATVPVVRKTDGYNEYQVLVDGGEWDLRFKPVYVDPENSHVPGHAVLWSGGNGNFTDGTSDVESIDFERRRVLETAFEAFAETVLTDIHGPDTDFRLAVYRNGTLTEY